MTTALICGISGQDGSLLAKFLINKGYRIYGTSRDHQATNLKNLQKLQIENQVTLLSMDPKDFRSVYVAISEVKPDEIYFLSGQSSVKLSFEQPAETIQSISMGTLNILEACRMFNINIKQYHAGSSEVFGNTNLYPANEQTPLNPRSPYAVAKASSFWLVANYREAYGMFACTGILFNHESSLRPVRFVTQKIIQSAVRIASGSNEKLELGRLDISRDWGWAYEYVDAMWRMLQQKSPEDFVIATGQTFTLKDFVVETFSQLGLDWKRYVISKEEFFRPTDIIISKANPALAAQKLDWRATISMPEIVRKMLNDELL